MNRFSNSLCREGKFLAFYMFTLPGCSASITEVSMSPAWMSIAFSYGGISPSGTPKRVQLVATTSMPKRTLASVATMVSSG